MASTVYFSERVDAASIAALLQAALGDMAPALESDDSIAIKVHFGEQGNTRFVPPAHIRPIAAALQRISPQVFLTDANTLYRGMRYNATDHLAIARAHGFEALGLPIVIADGEQGDDEVAVPVAGGIFKEVLIARHITQARAMVAVSHFKGHVMFGFGAAVKNIGMGSGSRAGKMAMHSILRPLVKAENCTACGTCIENCAGQAITVVDHTPVIDDRKCTGCAKCIAVCEFDAMDVPWGDATGREVMARTADYALGAAQGKKLVCVSFLTNITRDCDCLHDTPLIGHDVGIVAGCDPVACDQAAYDLIRQAHAGRDIFHEATGIDGTYQLACAEKLGLGRRAYTLKKL